MMWWILGAFLFVGWVSFTAFGILGFCHWYRQRNRRPVFVGYNGDTFEVDLCRCGNCKNEFWVRYSEIEPPKYCPYCGGLFTSHAHINPGEPSPI